MVRRTNALQSREGRSKLPPFGRELLELRRRGLVPDRTVVVSLDSWEWGKSYPRLVVPPELDPSGADFSMLAAITCFVAWSSRRTPIARRESLVRAIARVRPSSLWVCDISAPHEAFFVISLSRGIERPEYFK